MRGIVTGLPSPYPMGVRLPAMYADDELAQAITAACDEVLAPVLSVLDNLPSYLDPLLAPPDFVAWLGSWIAIEAPASRSELPDGRLRSAVAAGGGHLRRVGTPAAIAAEVALAASVPVEEVDVADSGGVAWSQDPAAVLPGQQTPRLAVRIRVPDPATVDMSEVEAAIAAVKPAHLPHTMTVVQR
ncbi:phage tail-like protein [Allocatelliglobosispora scoriae]|uniref:Phage tail-like protein n=1 Tax=Allocatelliglobosispora scoriae TaxID=643052 RepID=A0A841BM21_9ACTN|nr:phage tail protein [Allocatelliglobosispora scoriae]MBB5867911.1 phage tail-like protein [Allocatelliglobosispora scoriae]